MRHQEKNLVVVGNNIQGMIATRVPVDLAWGDRAIAVMH